MGAQIKTRTCQQFALKQSAQNFTYPPAQNQYMQEKFLGNYFFREYMRGLYSHSRESGNIFEESFSAKIAKFLREIISMSRLYSHPREYRKRFLGHFLCIGFVSGGTLTLFGSDIMQSGFRVNFLFWSGEL